MPLQLDHLVILVHDLEQAIADYSALGFNVQRGGTHADGITHNALVGFADGSYLELIAFLKAGTSHRWAKFHNTGYEGFIDFALLPDDVGKRVEATRLAGHPYEGPFDGGRVRLDGERLVWQIGQPPSAALPFLCGDVTPRSLRVREGDVRIHPNGVTGVAAVSVAVRDIHLSLARYEALLGPQECGGVISVPGLGIRYATVDLGLTKFVLLTAHGSVGVGGTIDTQAAPAATAVQQILERRGEGLLGVTLRRPSGSGPTEHLALGLTHGAWFETQAD